MEETPLSNACKWLVENPLENATVASRIFKIPRSTIQSSIARAARREQQQPPQHGGKNKLLSITQIEALKKWILEQYHLGLGATRNMIFAAVCKLRCPLPPPSQSWLTKFIKNELQEYHFITTKPIAQQRTKAQDEPTITNLFHDYLEFILQRSIQPESIWNMDETGFRVGIPGGERVIVPLAAKELYTSSPENRTSITILETVSAAGKVIPPVLIIPSKIHMDSWYHTNLEGTELFLLSDSGFTNSQLALRWLQHFAQHTAQYDNGEPKVLLLDSHPLNVGIFQPYKHWHREAVLAAIRHMDITYDLQSFMRDLTYMRQQTFKESTIISAFQKAGIWPVSCATALAKLRTYSQPTVVVEPTSLPTLPIRVSTPKPTTFRGVEEGLHHWKQRVPVDFSSPSKQSYRNWLTDTEEVMWASQLQELDLRTVRRQVEESKKRASRSRARLQSGGEVSADRAHELRAEKADRLAQKLQAKEARLARQAANRAQKQLRRLELTLVKQSVNGKRGWHFIPMPASQFL
ncbi:hypothetical protein V493_00034 [Pseudogymnoascus sp. VKM F-4281 (FW-2241)]|nr:hypothetical protein V493_00034 [Pseudogymnoascus sp. VKM F-4281 (FW-2241)]